MDARTRRPSRSPTEGHQAARRDRGQGLVEFVLVLPILLVLVFGIIEFGNAWRTYQLVTNTAREAARQAVLPSVDADSVNRVIDHRLSSSGLDPNQATVIFSCDGTNGSLCDVPGEAEGIQLQYPYTFRILGPVLNVMCQGCGDSLGTITLATNTVMRQE